MFLILRLGAESRVVLVNINSDILFLRIQLRLECCRSLTWGVVRVGREDKFGSPTLTGILVASIVNKG